MIMLERAGMYSCIADFEDKLLMDIAQGKRDDLVQVVHKVQDGEITSPDQVEGDEAKLFVRGARVILGHSLYSDSWMNM
jgi:5-methyltetrahydrofolate corrinoid/iron sulfur protein methyltransferase